MRKLFLIGIIFSSVNLGYCGSYDYEISSGSIAGTSKIIKINSEVISNSELRSKFEAYKQSCLLSKSDYEDKVLKLKLDLIDIQKVLDSIPE